MTCCGQLEGCYRANRSKLEDTNIILQKRPIVKKRFAIAELAGNKNGCVASIRSRLYGIIDCAYTVLCDV